MRDPQALAKLIETETAAMSDRDRVLVCKGAALALMVVLEEWRDVYSWLDNSRPDPIAVPPTVRR